jgi:hypothetical protein
MVGPWDSGHIRRVRRGQLSSPLESDKLINSSFQSILLKNSKDQVNKLEQELNFGKLHGPRLWCKLISSTRRIKQ